MQSNRLKYVFPAVILAASCTFFPFFSKAELGFWGVDQIKVPPEVGAAAESVFLATVPAGDKIRVDLEKFPTIDSALASLQDHGDLTEPEVILRKRVLARCFQRKAAECSIFSTFELGTIFLADQDQNALGAFHVFRDYLRDGAGPVELVIQDREGKIIFGATDDEVATVGFLHPEALAKEKKLAPFLVDFIHLQFPRSFGRHKPIAINFDSSPKQPEKIYHVGFPGPTYDRLRGYGKPDSDGVSQYITHGLVVSTHDYLRATGKDPEKIDPQVVNLLDQAHLYSDADSYPGMSGSPVLNEKGEVVGVLIGVFPVDGSASLLKTTVSIGSSWIRQLMIGR